MDFYFSTDVYFSATIRKLTMVNLFYTRHTPGWGTIDFSLRECLRRSIVWFEEAFAFLQLIKYYSRVKIPAKWQNVKLI